MTVTVKVRDETTSGDILGALNLQLEDERTTVRELIRARIHQEVRAFNAQQASKDRFVGLVQPTDAERELNGYRLKKPRLIDADKQIATAWRAFERGNVLLLVDDRQVEELDEDVMLRRASDVVSRSGARLSCENHGNGVLRRASAVAGIGGGGADSLDPAHR